MEDAHCVQLRYARNPDSAYFAVFDGHGGARFAEYCSSHLHRRLQNDPAFSKNVDVYILHVHNYVHVGPK